MNLQQIMQQAQKLQKQMKELQDKMHTKEVEAVAGGGLVKIIATAKGDVKQVIIDDSLMNIEEKDMLQDLIVAALKNLKNQADDAMTNEMKDMGISPEIMGSMMF